jgi:DNA invertase Pin-like site-specific DNA recombinase
MRIGYRRVSTLDQNTARQLDGVVLDKVFEDHASGKDTARPQLQAALEWAREGDTLVIHSMDRLARNLGDLLRIVADLTGRKVRVEFIKEALTFTGEDSPMATLMLSIMGAVAAFERAMILERQREGIALAKRAGKYRGRAPAIRPEDVALVRGKLATGISKTRIAAEMGVSRQTLYKHLAASEAASEAAPSQAA